MAEESNGTSPAMEAWEAGRKAYETSKYAEAAQHLGRAVAADPSQAGAWVDLGSARWRRGDRDGAIQAWRRATEEDPSRARAWHNLSTAFLSAGRFDEAAKAATRAVALDPSRAKAWNNLAVARERMGDAKGAETAVRRALEADPDLVVAWGNLGFSLLRKGEPTQAEAAFRKAIDGGADDPAFRVGVATAAEAAGDGTRAEDYLLAAAKAAPSSVDLWVALGDLRRRRGESPRALEAYDHAAAAATDMAEGPRSRVARRRRLAAVDAVRAAVARGDRDGATWGVARARAAGDGEAPASSDDESLLGAVRRAVDEATKAGRPEIPATWVENALYQALGLPREAGTSS
jgi:Tfp pilus assembly protein PilF